MTASIRCKKTGGDIVNIAQIVVPLGIGVAGTAGDRNVAPARMRGIAIAPFGASALQFAAAIKRRAVATIIAVLIVQLIGLPLIHRALGDDLGPSQVSGGKEMESAFTTALKKINDERSTNRANEFGVTQYFSDFYRFKQIGPYVAFFRDRGISEVAVDQNQEHFVYFTLSYKQLRAWGYRQFLSDDRLVLVFTTASANSNDITSFMARLFGRDYP